MYADPEITATAQEAAQWYYDGLQNVDDLYPAPGPLHNMEDIAGPSGTAAPTPTTGVAHIPTPPRPRLRAWTIGGSRPCSATI